VLHVHTRVIETGSPQQGEDCRVPNEVDPGADLDRSGLQRIRAHRVPLVSDAGSARGRQSDELLEEASKGGDVGDAVTPSTVTGVTVDPDRE
jgi:hypothetical protein